MCVPTPSDKYFDTFKTKAAEFLWESRTSKVRYEKVIQNVENGGLKMVDLQAKDLSIKAACVGRVIRNGSDSSPIFFYKLPIRTNIIWNCNLAVKEI